MDGQLRVGWSITGTARRQTSARWVRRLPSLQPLPLLLAIAGLALIGVLAQALGEMVRGPLLLGSLLAFVAASSQLTLFGLGPLFWGLVAGTGVSLLLEAEALLQLRATAEAGAGEE